MKVRGVGVVLVVVALAGGAPAPAEEAAPASIAVSLAPGVDLPGLWDELASFAWLRRGEAGAPADLTVTPSAGGLVVLDAAGAALGPAIDAAGSDATERIARELVAAGHRLLLEGLANPGSPLDVAFVLGRAGGSPEDGAVRVVEPGAELRWEARNRSGEPLWITVFALSPDRGVSVVHPFRGRWKALPPGERVDQTGRVDLPDGARTATDVLRLVATRERIDPAAFADPARLDEALAALARTAWWTGRHALVVRREVAEIVETPGIVEPGAPIVETAEGREAAEAPRIAPRRRPRVLHFGVYFAGNPELGAVRSRLAKLRTLCGRGGRACQVERLFPDVGAFEVRRLGRRLGEGRHQTVSSAFEQAYEIREGLEAARVEPFLELDMPVGLEPDGTAPAADDWHLAQVRAREAWAELRRRGRAAGREGEGILVGVVDTGYRAHPELGAALRADAGRDFVDGDDDASDPLLPGRPAALPAHGTAVASVVASPTGCQLEGQAGCVHGVGRGAGVAPLRAHRSVSHHHAGRLARVLYEAATGALPARVDLLSVSMAGPPGWALWHAAREAEMRGLLVVASAGQDVGTVLWPARFSSTIAVGGVDGSCRAWSRSPRGAALDVAAPAAGVWRATVGEAGEPGNAPGDSVGLATAATAGAASLWLARFAGTSALAGAREGGRLTAAFRDALRRSAWRPERSPAGLRCAKEPWPAGAGPGILDAAALVGTAPRSIAPGAAGGLGDLPLFRSVYAPADAARAAADYRRLFGLAPGADLERVAFFEAEVLHHYAMTMEVTRAIDALARASTDEAAADARRELLRQGLSKDLRSAFRDATPDG